MTRDELVKALRGGPVAPPRTGFELEALAADMLELDGPAVELYSSATYTAAKLAEQRDALHSLIREVVALPGMRSDFPRHLWARLTEAAK